ncbi:hypothetical protein E5D57_008692 [Metarhizium anisopliae]|nr:hypothetical protein E5D57_008692 [Metarhizium anisopliae]
MVKSTCHRWASGVRLALAVLRSNQVRLMANAAVLKPSPEEPIIKLMGAPDEGHPEKASILTNATAGRTDYQ